jgi:hypothetical protein
MAIQSHSEVMLERFESLERRLWLRQSRWRFDRLPAERRVRLEIDTDGRQLSFLLSAIHGAGLGVQLARGPMLFRELLSLRRHVPLAARMDSLDGLCALTLSDAPQAPGSAVQISYDVFSPGRDGARMPYGMHPSVYYKGAHLRPWDTERHADAARPIRVGFYGTHDPEFYSRSYSFPGLNRSELLQEFLSRYGEQLTPVPTSQPVTFGVSIDYRGGELQAKCFLPQRAYLRTLRHTAFVLCLPGWCMPLSHSLIEALYCGAIPITNSHTWMHPPLRHGVDALTFCTIAEFHAAIEEALMMPESKMQAMRHAAANYYKEHLEPARWWQHFVESRASRLLMNAEELSVPLLTISD